MADNIFTYNGRIPVYGGGNYIPYFNTDIYALGGNITTSGDYIIHTFLSSGTFSILGDGSKDIEYLIVAGGGSGMYIGGGGAGGLLEDTFTTLASGDYTMTVGTGGGDYNGNSPDQRSNGSDSTFNGTSSIGGGKGGNTTTAANDGGSGGGASDTGLQGAGLSGQGFGGGDGEWAPLYNGGGGGGAVAAGSDGVGLAGGAGGLGKTSSISGSAVGYAGGGGGGSGNTEASSAVATHGGGVGGSGTSGIDTDATANTGGGGGGNISALPTNPYGGAGGSGIIIVRYLATNRFDADALTFINTAGITDPTQQSAIDTLVVGLKADSIWTKLDAVYPLVGGSATTHKYNLKDPQDTDGAYRITWTGAVTHDSNGITGDGSTGYGNSFYTDTANDFSAGGYISNTTWTGNGLWGATTFPRQTQQYAPNGFSIQSGVENYAGGTSSAGFNQISRSGGAGTNVIIRQNGVTASHVATDAGVSSGVQNILRRNWSGAASDYVNANLRFMFFGTGLTTTDQENLETLVDAYQTSLSRNV